MKANPTYDQFKKHLSRAADLGYTSAVLSWDQQVLMPPNGAEFRGQQLATLAGLSHELLSSPKLGEWLKALSNDSSLTEPERINVDRALSDYERKKKYPSEFVEELSIVTSQAFGAWREAKQKKDFSIFAPHLEKVIALKKRETDIVGFKNNRYEALLHDYEPGLTVETLDRVFDQVKRELFPIIKEIQAKRQNNNSFLFQTYPKDKQWKFAKNVIEQMGYDFNSGRADDAPHPFCTTFGPGDVRITLRSDEKFFNMMLFASVHEAGHAMYELGLPMKEHYGLPMASPLSIAFHESQSRFWENNVGRSHAFWKGKYPELQALFPENLKNVDLQSFYRAINIVKPSFVRVEADELTYHAHIYIRYLIERALIDDQIQVKDIPQFWNDRYQEYLGVRPEHDGEGCLQDVHWSYGAFGYFPTYSLGSFAAAQLSAGIHKAIPEFDTLVESGNFKPLLQWLRKNIHSEGRRYTTNEILQKTTGSPLDAKFFMSYVKEKYGKIYSL